MWHKFDLLKITCFWSVVNPLVQIGNGKYWVSIHHERNAFHQLTCWLPINIKNVDLAIRDNALGCGIKLYGRVLGTQGPEEPRKSWKVEATFWAWAIFRVMLMPWLSKPLVHQHLHLSPHHQRASGLGSFFQSRSGYPLPVPTYLSFTICNQAQSPSGSAPN